MGFLHENLDHVTRQHMTAEIKKDIAADKLYLSTRLTHSGREIWFGLLLDAALCGTDDSLAALLQDRDLLNRSELRKKPRGGYSIAQVSATAHITLAEGEFNRFYVRGLCCRAIAQGIPRLELYRAKQVNMRPESVEKIGLLMDPEVVLVDVRASIGVVTAFGLPEGSNSGLTLRIPGGTVPDGCDVFNFQKTAPYHSPALSIILPLR
jgi:hypothetical protein